MRKIDKSKLPEVHIDSGSHNVNLSPLYSVYLPENGGYLSHRDRTEFTKRTAQKYAREFTEQHGKKAVVVPADEPPHVHHTNPAPRIGTARPRRKSQITGKSPSPRLVARRQANTRKGYFPNPVEDAGVKLLGEIQNAIVAVNTPTKLSSTMQNDLTKQARLSYAQGLITAGYILNVIDKVKRDDFMLSLKHSYQGQK